ncbi:hypothetical protein ACU635_44005 [[Actinomadura] parvosata]|uniref:hypothetical protein n=1 Tax=[Actinomadura] parvosata TaxID=1955412 RepID=UPI00406C1C88
MSDYTRCYVDAGDTVVVRGKGTEAGLTEGFAGYRLTVEIRSRGDGDLYPAIRTAYDPDYPITRYSMEEVGFYIDSDGWFFYPEYAERAASSERWEVAQ